VIPRDYITEWRTHAPWLTDAQVEQDLVISKALVDIYSHPLLKGSLAFRGGTALYKLHIKPPARYSEDIDLVQVKVEPAGPVMFDVEPTSKRRHGFPSETQVKRGHRVVGGHKELVEKLGRNDPCPCGSGRRFQEMLYAQGAL
jgi:predicted nucleotidyltransferase component of viral defense system